jgi:DNA-binding IclR family transcriptional regulator
MASDDQSGDKIQAVALTIDLIETLSRSETPLRVTQLAHALNVQKPRIYRHLRTLVELGYVQQDPETERYQLGLRLFLLGNRMAEKFELGAVVRESLRELSRRVGQTAVVAALDEERLRVVEVARPGTPIEIFTYPNVQLPLHATAQGMVALSFGPKKLLDSTLRRPLSRETAATIVDPAAILQWVARVRERGWAVAPGHSLEGVNAIAAPIWGASGAFVGTLALLGSVQQVKADPDEELVRTVVDAARGMSRLLGAEE